MYFDDVGVFGFDTAPKTVQSISGSASYLGTAALIIRDAYANFYGGGMKDNLLMTVDLSVDFDQQYPVLSGQLLTTDVQDFHHYSRVPVSSIGGIINIDPVAIHDNSASTTWATPDASMFGMATVDSTIFDLTFFGANAGAIGGTIGAIGTGPNGEYLTLTGTHISNKN